MVAIARTALAVMIVVAVITIAIGFHGIRRAHSREAYPGQYAQYSPEIKKWFNEQVSPKTGVHCCSTSDGTYAEEEIRDGHYWTRFTTHRIGNPDMDSGWMQVPDDTVLTSPNRNGAAVVWYYYENYVLKIRCFAAGAKL
jgi:hypothetical protein